MSMVASGANVGNRMTGAADVIPKGYKMGQLQQFTPEQMQLFQQQFGHVAPGGFLSQLAGGNEAAFQQMEAPAWRNFQQGIGQLGSRYSELAPGAMSARKGSGFQNEATQFASDFAQDLASQRMKIQRQALMDLMGISDTLLRQSPYERFLIEKQKKKSGLPGLIGAGLGAAGGFFAGGPAGAIAGAKLGHSVGSKF